MGDDSRFSFAVRRARMHRECRRTVSELRRSADNALLVLLGEIVIEGQPHQPIAEVLRDREMKRQVVEHGENVARFQVGDEPLPGRERG